MIESNAPRSSWSEQHIRAFARERILTVLRTSQRPLRWAELVGLLGGLTPEARMECEWLMDHGYIAPIRPDDGGDGEALWTFGERGLAWAERHGETMPSVPPARDNAYDVYSDSRLAPGRSAGDRFGVTQDPG